MEDGIVESFRNGGGVPYASFERFHAVMAEDSEQTVVPAILDQDTASGSRFRDALEEGLDVLDLGCGSGRALNVMAQAFPDSSLQRL